MSGVVFVVCVPTAEYERTLQYGIPPLDSTQSFHEPCEDFLHINVNLRDKNSDTIPISLGHPHMIPKSNDPLSMSKQNAVSMEKILEELLKKLEVEHVVWCKDRHGNYYEVFFPVPAGDPCENVLHCLTELGIGKKANSVVSVLPCSVVYSGLQTESEIEDFLLRSTEEKKQWKCFVDSIRSKLTVKQVVDGVRSGGKMSFDYLLLIITADCLAALGLVENNSPNIVAAMLVSPLMGPVMSITFGTIISDRSLQKAGLFSLVIGMLMSCIFGFIFGLILGTTEMPWGFGDWPTEEMKGRGNVRSLWMGVLWALTSGSGVAVALLQGSAGPLIGVAISASLLPPVVNCGLYWALACIWLIYDGVKIPHIKGESYYGNSSYVPLYSDYIPIEFAVNGIVSACLTVVNVICIFITAIIVLKIKEVAAPYTSSPDLQRFWQHDLRIVRESNRASMRAAEDAERKEYMMNDLGNDEINVKLDEAIKEAIDDETFRKVQRVSYQTHGMEDVGRLLLSQPSSPLHRTCSIAHNNNSTNNTDLATLDKLVTVLLNVPNDSPVFNRYKSKSFKSKRSSMRSNASSSIALPTILENNRNNEDANSTERSNSWSENVFNNPIVSNILQSLKHHSRINENRENFLINDENEVENQEQNNSQ